MKKIYDVNLRLDKIKAQKNKYVCSENMSILEFISYKSLLAKEKRLNKTLHKLYLLQKEVNFLYDINTKSWIANPKINCRTYYKLEQNAAYKKNLTLYKLGVSSKKPTPPIIQNIKSKFEPYYDNAKSVFRSIKKFVLHSIRKSLFIQKIKKSFHSLISLKIPHYINSISINTAKLFIKGYSRIKKECSLTVKSLSSKKFIKYIKNTMKEAHKQMNMTNSCSTVRYSNSLLSHPKYTLEDSKQIIENHYSISEKEKSFKESLKVTSENLIMPAKSSFNPIMKKYEKNLSL